MGYEQNITVFAVIAVTLLVLWYVDKEIKILRNDVNNMKDGLSLNIQMFQKLKSAYQSIPVALGNRPPSGPPPQKQVPETIKEKQEELDDSDNSCKIPSKLETIQENEEPLASNDVQVLPEQKPPTPETPVTKPVKKGRKKVESSVV